MPHRFPAMSARETVVEDVETFLAKTGLSEWQFGMAAVGDHKFLKRLRSGHGVTLTVIEKAERFMREHSVPPAADPPEAA